METLEERYCLSVGPLGADSAMLAVPAVVPVETTAQDIRALVQKYDEGLSWIDSHTLVDDYYVFDIDHPLHQVVLELQPVQDSEFTNLPVGAQFAAIGQVRGLNVVVDQELTHVYLSSTSDFANAPAVCIGEEALPERMWFPTELTSATVKFQYGYLHLNAFLSDTLVDMYQITGDDPYLERAQTLLTRLSSFIEPDGRFYRRFEGVDIPKYYNGMNQGIVMQSLDKFLSVVGPRPHLQGQLIRMALGYRHTTEGVFNHFSNSLVGNLIRDGLLQEHTVDYEHVDFVLERLYEEINTNDGRIPKVIDPSSPSYPTFSSGYQPYDTYLVALLTKYLPFEINYDTVFEEAFAEARKVNAVMSMGHNSASLRYMRESYGRLDPQFAAEVLSNVINTDIGQLTRIQEVLNVMMAAAHLIKYESAAFDLDRNGSLDSDDVDWLFGALDMAPVPLPIGSRFDIDGNGIVDTVDIDAWLAGAARVQGLDDGFRGGDLNLDGKIDLDDYSAFIESFNEADLDKAGWGEGDFDGNGSVDADDFVILTTNWLESPQL